MLRLDIHPDDVPYGPGNSDYESERSRDLVEEMKPEHEKVADRLAREAHLANAHAFSQLRVEIDEAFRKIIVSYNRSIAQRRRFLRIRQLQGAKA